MSSRKYNIDNILGWNAPHIHFTAEAIKAAAPKVEDDSELSPYEAFLKSIGMLRR